MSGKIESKLHSLGFELMNRPGSKVGTVDGMNRFAAFFGTSAYVLAIVWKLLFENFLLDDAEYVHLLWGCMLLKQYSGDRVLSAVAGVNEKTFRKWERKIIDAMSWLEGDVVSLNFAQ